MGYLGSVAFAIFIVAFTRFLLAWGQVLHAKWEHTALMALIWHGLVYPASNGYNSWIDRDTEAIGGLEHPPLPPVLLPWVCVFFDLLALVNAWWISPAFAVALPVFILVSRAYSAPWPRLKRFPWISFIVVSVFQGAWTYLASVYGLRGAFEPQDWIMALVCSAFIGGAYPLSQIYQHESDAARGDLTLSRVLGRRGTLIWGVALNSVAVGILFVLSSGMGRWILVLCLAPALARLWFWAQAIWQDDTRANFRETMRTQWLSAMCLNLACLGLVWLSHL